MATVRMTRELRERILYTAERASGLRQKLLEYQNMTCPEFDEAMRGAWINFDMQEKIQALPRALFAWYRDCNTTIAGFAKLSAGNGLDPINVDKWANASIATTIPAEVPKVEVYRPADDVRASGLLGDKGLRVAVNGYYGGQYIILCEATQAAYRIYVDKMNASQVVQDELSTLRRTVDAATPFNTLKQCLEFWPALAESVPDEVMETHKAPSPKRRKKEVQTPYLAEETKARATAIATKLRMNKGV